MTDLILGVRLTPFNKMNIIKLNNVDLKETVTKLRNEVAEQINLPKNSFGWYIEKLDLILRKNLVSVNHYLISSLFIDLIYCGCFLENDSTLESCGLKNGSMIHVLKKKEHEEKDTPSSENTSNHEINLAVQTSLLKSFIGDQLLELVMRVRLF